ncbi:MAG: hypothetical protein ACTS4X_00680 [Candidatus Hodgkinia cicadicola]
MRPSSKQSSFEKAPPTIRRYTCGRPDPSSPLRRNLATSDYVNHQHNFGRNNPNSITSIPPKGGLG